MNVPFFIKEQLWMSASDEATFKKTFGGSKPISKLILKTKWYQRCDDSLSCERLKKCVTDKYFEKNIYLCHICLTEILEKKTSQIESGFNLASHDS